jgi:hypothetical protein
MQFPHSRVTAAAGQSFNKNLVKRSPLPNRKKQKTFISNLKKSRRKKKKQNYKAANFFFFFYCIDNRKELQQITCQVPGCPRQTSA